MPQLNFSAQFAPLVESGQKRQTIRAPRKNAIRPHDVLHLFTGLRTKQARRLMPPQRCEGVDLIQIRWKTLKNSTYRSLEVKIHGKGSLRREEIESLAKQDGFENVEAFTAWFLPEGTNEFTGHLIRW